MKCSSQIVFAGGILAIAPSLFATPSGLNNIPTADTAPDVVPVIQAYSTFGEGRGPDHSSGLKFGLGPWDKSFFSSRFEFGVDGRYAPEPIGPALFQGKYAVQPWEKGPVIALGVANVAMSETDRHRAGQPFSYAVLSQNLHYFRAHLMETDNTHKFKAFSEVKTELEAAGVTPDKQILCYCGTSREGSLLRFYLKHVAHDPNVRLYEGAWKEYVWLKNQSLPAETTEGKAH